jgi:hypothetical protein
LTRLFKYYKTHEYATIADNVHTLEHSNLGSNLIHSMCETLLNIAGRQDGQSFGAMNEALGLNNRALLL